MLTSPVARKTTMGLPVRATTESAAATTTSPTVITWRSLNRSARIPPGNWPMPDPSQMTVTSNPATESERP